MMTSTDRNYTSEDEEPEEIAANQRLLDHVDDNSLRKPDPEDDLPRSVLIRNLVAFWLLGLCNNYAYCIMLSAAHDILNELGSGQQTPADPTDNGFLPERKCNPMSTGTILLANIIPSLVIKMVAPFVLSFTTIQIGLSIILAIASFLLVYFSTQAWLTFTGVVCASLSSGLGEVTLLRFSTSYTKNTVSTWASGTGASGVLGAFSYASITSAGVSPRNTVLIMLCVPILMAVTFYVILVHPEKMNEMRTNLLRHANVPSPGTVGENSEHNIQPVMIYQPLPPVSLSFLQKLRLIVPLLKYMIPLTLVYFAEYFINQGLIELIYIDDFMKMSHDAQYRWYQVMYQIGVFISRSSVNLVSFNKLWIFPILQLLNVVIFIFEAYYLFIPSVLIVFALILYEGLIGGASYVNTFYKITQEVEDPYREFCMGAAAFSDSFGVTVAGFISIPVHDLLCRTPIP